MKNLLLGILILLLFQVEGKVEYVSIEHVGIQDRPITTINICKKPCLKKFPINNILNKTYYVEKDDYRKLTKVVEINKSNADISNSIEYGTFKITTHQGDSVCQEFELKRKKSNIFFDQMIDSIMIEPSNEDLLSELQKISNRIRLK
jgi:hypothetical protein